MKAVNTVVCHACNHVVPAAPGFCVLCGVNHVEVFPTFNHEGDLEPAQSSQEVWYRIAA